MHSHHPSQLARAPRFVLFVDPDADTHDLYRAFLVPRGYIVEHAQEGRFALARGLASPPDILVTEARVPGIDGIALCALLRADPVTATVPVVVMTTDARPALHEAAYRAGATRVLVKPCLPDQLWRALQDIQEGRYTPVHRLAIEERLARTRARDHQRYVTTLPPLSPPPLRCPQCDATLAYDRSHVGGVTARFSEQWDYYRCPTGCGDFQYRHRTRKVSRSAA
jgi:CheY-like chemotaxis protein